MESTAEGWWKLESRFFQVACTFILPKGSRWTLLMSRSTLELMEIGSVPTIDKFFARTGLCDSHIDSILTFQKLKVFFFLAYGFCSLVFFELVFDPQTPLSKKKSPGIPAKEEFTSGSEMSMSKASEA